MRGNENSVTSVAFKKILKTVLKEKSKLKVTAVVKQFSLNLRQTTNLAESTVCAV